MPRLLQNTVSVGVAAFYALAIVLGHALHDHGDCQHASCASTCCESRVDGGCSSTAAGHQHQAHDVKHGATGCGATDHGARGPEESRCPCGHHHHGEDSSHTAHDSLASRTDGPATGSPATDSPATGSPATGSPATGHVTQGGPQQTQSRSAIQPGAHACLGCELISQLSVGYTHGLPHEVHRAPGCAVACSYHSPYAKSPSRVRAARGPPALC